MNKGGKFFLILLLAVVALLAGVYAGKSGNSTSQAAKIDKAAVEHLFASRWRDAEDSEIAFSKWRGNKNFHGCEMSWKNESWYRSKSP
jgi:hypothetical protein